MRKHSEESKPNNVEMEFRTSCIFIHDHGSTSWISIFVAQRNLSHFSYINFLFFTSLFCVFLQLSSPIFDGGEWWPWFPILTAVFFFNVLLSFNINRANRPIQSVTRNNRHRLNRALKRTEMDWYILTVVMDGLLFFNRKTTETVRRPPLLLPMSNTLQYARQWAHWYPMQTWWT